MAQQIKVKRGMHDILPSEMNAWNQLEDTWRQLVEGYGYQQIRTPILEKTALFKRSIGEVTDIVEKEMYSFEDRGGDNLSLRPEGTASVVRSGIECGLLFNQQQRLWYNGPMFRRERPQKGRYRQNPRCSPPLCWLLTRYRLALLTVNANPAGCLPVPP